MQYKGTLLFSAFYSIFITKLLAELPKNGEKIFFFFWVKKILLVKFLNTARKGQILRKSLDTARKGQIFPDSAIRPEFFLRGQTGPNTAKKAKSGRARGQLATLFWRTWRTITPVTEQLI